MATAHTSCGVSGSAEGLRPVQLLLRETEVDALIESGWLEERSSNDLSAMIDALHRVFSSMTRATPRGQ
jgi:hypothetical protein